MNSLQYLTNPAAGLRVIICVDQAIEAINKEREIVVFPRRCHLGDWNHANLMMLQHSTGNIIQILTDAEDNIEK